VSSDANDQKIISLALSSDENENPFQQSIGLGDFMVFGPNDPGARGPILRRLTEVFRRFEAQRRYRLVEESIRWGGDSATQEMSLGFRFLNLESDQESDFNIGFDAAGRTVTG
jgi:hypothetical protein